MSLNVLEWSLFPPHFGPLFLPIPPRISPYHLQDVIEEEIVEIPKIQNVERLLQREIEQEIEVPKYVEVEKRHVHHHRHVVEQRQKTVEVVKEKIVEKVIERRKPLVQEKVVHVPKYVEVEKRIKVEKLVEVPVWRDVERIVEVPKVTVEETVEEYEVIKKVGGGDRGRI